jgi:hypothetical protein
MAKWWDSDLPGIMGIVGPEGAGKTCGMAYFGLRRIANKGKVLTFPGFTITNGNGKQLSEPIETEEWITMPPELRDVLICIDEIQNFFSSSKYMSTLNYLFANFSAQRRHRNMGLVYTVQDWGWLDPRIRWLTHILVTCYDLYWSPWGKEQGLERGELISMIFFDVKGFYTGKPWTPSPPFNLRAKSIWQCYNSFADVDMWSGMSKVNIKKPSYTIDLTPPAEGKAPPDPGGIIPSSPNEDVEILTDLSNRGVDPTTIAKLTRRLMAR